VRALAHRVRGEHDQARTALERALALGGPLDAELRAELAQLGSARPALEAPRD
jgi:hypothetical protein